MTTRTPIRMGEPPEPGFYLRRLVRGGPWVGCQIAYDPAEGYSVMEDGIWEGPMPDLWMSERGERVILATKATEAEVQFRIGIKRWSEIYAPSAPAANPHKAINLDTHRSYTRKT